MPYDFGIEWFEAVGLTAGAFLAFALVHSFFVTDIAKRSISRLFGKAFTATFYRFTYTCFSFLTVIIAIWLISLIPDERLFTGPAWFQWTFRSLQAVGLVIGLASFRRLDMREFLGVAQIKRYLRGKEKEEDGGGKTPEGDAEGITMGFVATGVYSVVRHPLYLAGIMIFTFSPDITRNWLTVRVLADIYFILGAFIEEKRLLERFGEEYREYRKEVPMLVPNPVKLLKALYPTSRRPGGKT